MSKEIQTGSNLRAAEKKMKRDREFEISELDKIIPYMLRHELDANPQDPEKLDMFKLVYIDDYNKQQLELSRIEELPNVSYHPSFMEGKFIGDSIRGVVDGTKFTVVRRYTSRSEDVFRGSMSGQKMDSAHAKCVWEAFGSLAVERFNSAREQALNNSRRPV